MRTLITNARIVDGTGSPAFRGEVLLDDGHIAGVNDGAASAKPDHVLDARGMVVAPGFIDMHSHGDFTLPRDPDANAKLLQGITMEVVGNCGQGLCPANANVEAMYRVFTPIIFGEQGPAASYSSLQDFREKIEANGVAVNVACLIPHGNVRCWTMSMAERAPTPAEMRAMTDLIAQQMDEGAFGLSSGLVYPPGAYADTAELVELARAVKPFQGFYASHIRDEGTRLVESVTEALRVGEDAGVPVQISHHKAIGYFNRGKVKTTLAMVDAARARGMDVHSDVYPYTAGSTVLSAILLAPWVFEGSTEQMQARLRDPESRARMVRESEERLEKFVKLPGALGKIPGRWLVPVIRRLMAHSIIVSSVKRHHEYEGMSLAKVARVRKQEFYEAMLDLLAEEEAAVAAIAHVMWEPDVERVLSHPATMVGTDGFPIKDGKPHPRTYGTFPRVLEHYVREKHLLTLEDAVHRMTGLPARKLGLGDRGVIREGARADVVVFDPERVHDRATYRDPKRAPLGIPHVFVNGEWTVRDGAHTGARAGRVLKKQPRN